MGPNNMRIFRTALDIYACITITGWVPLMLDLGYHPNMCFVNDIVYYDDLSWFCYLWLSCVLPKTLTLFDLPILYRWALKLFDLPILYRWAFKFFDLPIFYRWALKLFDLPILYRWALTLFDLPILYRWAYSLNYIP
jgi:hypothetical protein